MARIEGRGQSPSERVYSQDPTLARRRTSGRETGVMMTTFFLLSLLLLLLGLKRQVSVDGGDVRLALDHDWLPGREMGWRRWRKSVFRGVRARETASTRVTLGGWKKDVLGGLLLLLHDLPPLAHEMFSHSVLLHLDGGPPKPPDVRELGLAESRYALRKRSSAS